MPYNPVKNRRDPKPHKTHKTGVRTIALENGELRHPSGDQIDLHFFLTKGSISAYLMKMSGNLMRASGIPHGAYLVADKTIQMRSGQIVVVRFNGQLVVRRIMHRSGEWFFEADDPREPPLKVTEADEIERLGVIRAAIVPFVL